MAAVVNSFVRSRWGRVLATTTTTSIPKRSFGCGNNNLDGVFARLAISSRDNNNNSTTSRYRDCRYRNNVAFSAFSTAAPTTTITTAGTAASDNKDVIIDVGGERKKSPPPKNTDAANMVYEAEDGRRFFVFDRKKKQPKLKPSIVKRRLDKMRLYEGKEKNIRHSPWRLNLICQFVAGMTVQEALTQLEFLNKRMAPLVLKVVRRTANLADVRDGLQPSQLEIAECFATKGVHLKRIKPMGRGRHGIMHHKHSHMRIVLREIDFKLRIYQAPSLLLKKKWLQRQIQAEEDGNRVQAERQEMERLEAREERARKEREQKQMEEDAKNK